MPKLKPPKLDPLTPLPFSEAGSCRFWCVKCGLCEVPIEPEDASDPYYVTEKFRHPFVPKGWTGKLLLIGIMPGDDGWLKLRELWRQAGWKDVDVACMREVRTLADATMSQIRACRPFLLRALEVLKPEIVIALGTEALHAVTNLGKGSVLENRGALLDVPGYSEDTRIFCTYHPKSCNSGGDVQLEKRILEDLERHKWPILEWPFVAPISKHEKLLGVDFEYSPSGELLDFGISEGGLSETITNGCYPDEARAFKRVIISMALADYICAHFIPADIDHLVRLGCASEKVCLGERILDTWLLERMLDENRGKGGYKLENLLRSYFNVKPWKHKTEAYSKEDATKWPADLRAERCRLDAWASAVLAKHLTRKAIEEQSFKLLRFQHRLATTLHRIHLAGATVDMKKFAERGKFYRDSVFRHEQRILHLGQQHNIEGFDPGNPNHLRTLLFEKLGLPIENRTNKTELPSVDKHTLALLKDKHPIVEDVLEYSKYSKVVRTWYGHSPAESGPEEKEEGKESKALVDLIKPSPDGDPGKGVLNFTLIPMGARTWRRASVRPNSQNWPEEVRQIIISRWPGGKILNADYKQIEPTIMAWVAGEEAMLDAFENRGGYVGIGTDFWGKTVDKEKTPKEYVITKSMVLGIGYGMGAWKMAHDLETALGVRLDPNWKKHVAECQKLIDKYFKMFPQIEQYIQDREAELISKGISTAPDGAVRHLPCPNGKDTPGYRHLRNEAINFPIQHTASMVTGSALLDIEEEIVNAHYGARYLDWHRALIAGVFDFPHFLLINEVHDSIVSDLHPDRIEEDTELIIETMKAVPTLRKLWPEMTFKLGVDFMREDCWTSK